MPIRFGSREHGPLPDGLQASAAARTRRGQKSVARKRQSHKRWRSRPRYGPHGWQPSYQRVEAAATRRHPLAATLSCPRPPNLRRPVRIDGRQSATSEIRVQAGSNTYLGHTLTAYRAGSERISSNLTRDGWRCCRAPFCEQVSLPFPDALRDRYRSWTATRTRCACVSPSKKFWRPLSTARMAGASDDIGPSPLRDAI